MYKFAILMFFIIPLLATTETSATSINLNYNSVVYNCKEINTDTVKLQEIENLYKIKKILKLRSLNTFIFGSLSLLSTIAVIVLILSASISLIGVVYLLFLASLASGLVSLVSFALYKDLKRKHPKIKDYEKLVPIGAVFSFLSFAIYIFSILRFIYCNNLADRILLGITDTAKFYYLFIYKYYTASPFLKI